MSGRREGNPQWGMCFKSVSIFLWSLSVKIWVLETCWLTCSKSPLSGMFGCKRALCWWGPRFLSTSSGAETVGFCRAVCLIELLELGHALTPSVAICVYVVPNFSVVFKTLVPSPFPPQSSHTLGTLLLPSRHPLPWPASASPNTCCPSSSHRWGAACKLETDSLTAPFCGKALDSGAAATH